MSLVNKINWITQKEFFPNLVLYVIGVNDSDDLPESLFAKWVIENYDENELHEWIMYLLSSTIDIEDMEGTFRQYK